MRVARRQARALAERQAADIERVVARAGVLSARLYKVASVAAKANKVHHETVIRVRDYDPELVQQARDELTDVMVYSFLLKRSLAKRRRRAAKGIQFASPVNKAAKQLADRFELDLGKLRNKFDPISGEAIDLTLTDIRRVMNGALEDATRESKSTGEATDDVIDALREHGLSPRSNAYVERLVRTHSAIAYGAAHKLSFADDPDVWGFEYVTVGDDRVRESHEKLDGVKRRADDKFWQKFWPPNGWNCRCQAIAIYDEDEKQDPVPKGAEPDEGFDFDPAELME